MYSWESSYNNVDLFGNNYSDEYEEIIFSQRSTGDDEFFVDEYQNNEVSNEEENPVEEETEEKKKPVEEEPKKEEKLIEKKLIEEKLIEEKLIEEKLIEKNSECKNDKNILTKKKRKREKNKDKDNNNNKIRKDNIFKQVKIHSIKFVIDTINDIAEKENINSFYRLNKNKIKNDIKDRVQKSFNFEILDMTIREMLEVDDYNKGAIDYFEKNIKNEKSLKLINGFLNKKLFEVIEIFNMSNEKYNNEFQSDNKFLLFQKKIKNKEKLIELIIFGVKDYLALKKERNRKID